MRNTFGLITCCGLALLAGCGPDAKGKDELTQGYAALADQDAAGAQTHAETFLAHTPAGPGTAEALYLKGRALEQKRATGSADARSNLAEARAAYVQALARQPGEKLTTYLHASLGNVAYFQDDYTSAINEWTMAYDKLDDDAAKPWVLYRLGVCKQRTGAFADADATFAAVQQQYPDTVPAERAHEHQGVRNFFVQLASFSAMPMASAAVGELGRQGVAAVTKADGKGHTVLLAGPQPSYPQAAALRMRLAAKYPDALILP